ncbi:MAG TPA: flagellar hook basal-body protein [Planctomycetaceae bacterium]|nr:flagellar hook basal-body protein [Planctomycetaceae bacterium]
MDPRRTTLVGGAALFVIVGLAAANVILRQPVDEPPSARPPRAAGRPQTHDTPAAQSFASWPASPESTEPRRIDARRFASLRMVEAREEREAAVPGTLSDTGNAIPLPGPGGATDREILSIIDEELPAASEMEREVWLDELRDVGLDTTRRILRLWKQQRPIAPDETVFHQPAPASPAPPPGPAAVVALDADFDRDQLISQIGPSLDAIRQARDVILNNVANAGTVGFKRSEVLFAESGPHPHNVCCEDGQGVRTTAGFATWGEGAAVVEIRLDLSPGRLERTGRPLDVAIAGAGFLQVRCGEELLLTRAGRLSRGEGGQLVVAGPHGPCALEPPVIVPDEAADVYVARDGAVAVRLTGQECPLETGRILLARCADPTALVPRGGGLFAPTGASGTPQTGTPGSDGLGKLRQGSLEQSNVALEQETATFLRLQAQIDALSQIVSRAIPFASSRPMNLVAAPPDEGADGGPELAPGPNLIDEYLHTRQAERDGGPELR